MVKIVKDNLKPRGKIRKVKMVVERIKHFWPKYLPVISHELSPKSFHLLPLSCNLPHIISLMLSPLSRPRVISLVISIMLSASCYIPHHLYQLFSLMLFPLCHLLIAIFPIISPVYLPYVISLNISIILSPSC